MTAPTAPSPGAGGWAPDVSAAGPEWLAATEDQRRNALDVAVQVVWTLSGRQYGVAGILLAPWVPYTPASVYWRTLGRPWDSPHMRERFDRSRRILLPGPVVDVHEVKIGDVVLPAGDEWAIEPTGHLVRREGSWPSQDLNWPLFTVNYTRGVLVPRAGQIAAGAYAEEWIKGRAGDRTCKLPARTRSIQRAGVSMDLVSPEDLTNAGLTGIKAVDDFIASANPNRITSPPTAWSPETGMHRVMTAGVAPEAVPGP